MFASFVESVQSIINGSGFVNATWQQLVMIGISCVLIYLAIAKKFEPMLLVPIGFGIIMGNIPFVYEMDTIQRHRGSTVKRPSRAEQRLAVMP